jgi:hypothetical protein
MISKKLTYEPTSLLNVIHATSRYKSGRFRYKSIDVALTSFPMMNGYVTNIADITKGGEWRMKE